MIQHDLVQGSAAWHEYRAKHFNASDAPAMMGFSPYKTRTQLLQEYATGFKAEPGADRQALFANGHRYEALARPLGEEIVGEDLYPVVGSNGKLSASFDGLTMAEDVAFEHKSLNAELRDCMVDGCEGDSLPLNFQVQMEQQCMVAGCSKVLFMASQWTADNKLVESRHCWYTSNPDLAAKIRSGWAQFEKDLDGYVPPAAAAPAPVAASIQALPALMVNVEGKVTASNLEAFKASAESFLANISTDLTTDQHFADAEKTVKFCKEGEERLELVKAQALAQTATIDELFRAIDHIKEQLRAKRLALDKLVTTRKADIRSDIVAKAQAALDAHVAGLNARLGAQWVPRRVGPFADAIKGLKSLDSIQNAADTALANAKIAASAAADQFERNRKALVVDGTDWFFLFADFAQVGAVDHATFLAVANQRRNEHIEAAAAEVTRKAAALAAVTVVTNPHTGTARDPRDMATDPKGVLIVEPGAPMLAAPNDPATLGVGGVNIYFGLGITMTAEFIELTLGVRRDGEDPKRKTPTWRGSSLNAIARALAAHAMKAVK